MTPLPPEAAAKLAKVCGMLGSDHDGERSAAAWQATRILRLHGKTWSDLFPAERQAPEPRRASNAPSHVAATTAALQHLGHLTAWELRFLRDIARRSRLSPKQATTLDGIMRKLRAAGVA